jgi:hypothetical protein
LPGTGCSDAQRDPPTVSGREFGPRLMRFVDAELAARGMTANGLSVAHGIGRAQFGRWRAGIQPRVDAVVEVAVALGVPPLDLLAVMIGVEQENEVGVESLTMTELARLATCRVRLAVSGCPDMRGDSWPFRPDLAVAEFEQDDAGGWSIVGVSVSGPRVLKTGGVSPGQRAGKRWSGPEISAGVAYGPDPWLERIVDLATGRAADPSPAAAVREGPSL